MSFHHVRFCTYRQNNNIEPLKHYFDVVSLCMFLCTSIISQYRATKLLSWCRFFMYVFVRIHNITTLRHKILCWCRLYMYISLCIDKITTLKPQKTLSPVKVNIILIRTLSSPMIIFMSFSHIFTFFHYIANLISQH